MVYLYKANVFLRHTPIRLGDEARKFQGRAAMERRLGWSFRDYLKLRVHIGSVYNDTPCFFAHPFLRPMGDQPFSHEGTKIEVPVAVYILTVYS